MQKNVLLIAEIIKAGRASLERRGFIEVVTPRVVRATGACENVNTLFEVSVSKDFKWFGSSSYLAQTGQLYLEALVPAYQKVYCSGPSFRAEATVDARHLVEFMMMEIEFAGGFDQLLKEIEAFIFDIAKTLVNVSKNRDLGLGEENLKRLASCLEVFTKLTYDEAIAKLQELGEQIVWGDDINSAREKLLVEN